MEIKIHLLYLLLIFLIMVYYNLEVGFDSEKLSATKVASRRVLELVWKMENQGNFNKTDNKLVKQAQINYAVIASPEKAVAKKLPKVDKSISPQTTSKASSSTQATALRKPITSSSSSNIIISDSTVVSTSTASSSSSSTTTSAATISTIKTPNFTPQEAPIIPFYIYQGTRYPSILKLCPKQVELKAYHQQADDVQFMRQIYTHPWRTLKKSEAKIFIIPMLLNFMIIHKFNYHCGPYRLIDINNLILKNLLKEPTFQKNNGKDHLLVSSEWRLRIVDDYPWSSEFLQFFRKILVGNYEVLNHMLY